ncbi:MAG: hypothetical protein J5758_03005, partial [Abditibacteriota bacterium]|nr:hypothetical protein [Abditibacteriota bacterium]
EDAKGRLQARIDSLKKLLESSPDDPVSINAATDELEKASYEIASILYKQQTAGQAGQQSGGYSEEPQVNVPSEDDVVEAEFKEE